MPKTVKIKKDKSKPTICHTCLSTDRDIRPAGIYEGLYRIICQEIVKDDSKTYICWECRGVLRKLKLFKEQAITAWKMLKLYNSTLRRESFPTLSKLKITKQNEPLTITEEEINDLIKQEDCNTKLDLNIKEEPNDYYDQDNSYMTLDELKDYEGLEIKVKDYIPLDDIKTEEPVLKKFNIRKRKKNYTIAYHSSVNVPRKEKIRADELASWIENERNSSYFVNLKKKCDKCLRALCKNETLNDHNENFHDEKNGRFICDVCSLRFQDKRAISLHVSNHYYIRCCTACSYKCYSPIHMYEHMRSHRTTVKCKECEALFSNARDFFKHYKLLHSEFICDYCNKKWYSKSFIEKHMKQHNAICKICNVKYKNQRTLRNHNELKHLEAPTEDSFCVQCNKQFSNIHLFRRHVSTSVAHASENMYRDKSNSKKKVKCPVCDKEYSRQLYMDNHYRFVHAKQSRYVCVQCDKQFLNRTKYLSHQREVHEEGYVKPKNKMCNVCGRGFHTNRILLNHMRTHTGERPYQCPHCPSKFAQKQAMKSHVRFIHMKSERTKKPRSSLGIMSDTWTMDVLD